MTKELIVFGNKGWTKNQYKQVDKGWKKISEVKHDYANSEQQVNEDNSTDGHDQD